MEKEIAIRDFRAMWNELAETGSDSKSNVTVIDVKKYLNRCPLCQYVSNLEQIPINRKDGIGSFGTIEYCKSLCPISWPWNEYEHSICFGVNALYTKWGNANTILERKKIALEIANLPERETEKEVI